MNIEKWLHYLKSITNLKVLINSLNLTPETEANFWKDLLATLRSEESYTTIVQIAQKSK